MLFLHNFIPLSLDRSLDRGVGPADDQEIAHSIDTWSRIDLLERSVDCCRTWEGYADLGTGGH